MFSQLLKCERAWSMLKYTSIVMKISPEPKLTTFSQLSKSLRTWSMLQYPLLMKNSPEPGGITCRHWFRRRPWYRHRGMSHVAEMNSQRLVWIDMEMTGLDPEVDRILEVACVITDGQLNIVCEELSFIIHQPPNVLANMNEWCIVNHAKSGLTDACKASTISVEEAESKLYDLIAQNTPQGKCPLAGSSVYGDRMFLKKYMPRIDEHLHYRIVDVSAVKELCRRWFPSNFAHIEKSKRVPHRALGDIKMSIEELKYYKLNVFKH